MAVVRARSAPPYGLFMVMAWATIATALAILFYVMYARSGDEVKTATDERNMLMNSADKPLLATYKPKDKDVSVLQAMNKKIQDLQTQLSKAQQDLQTANADRAQKQRDLTQANEAVRQSGEAAKTAQASAKTQIDASSNSVLTQGDTIKKLQSDLIAAVQARDQAVKDGEQKLSDSQAKFDEQLRQHVLSEEDYKAQLARQDLEIRELRTRIQNQRGDNNNPVVGEADGRIIRVDAATGTAWINLTANDRVKPGMTFTSYDPRTGVRFGTDEDALGNGSLEVTEVGNNYSICRITRSTRNKAVQAGDLIANLVYHTDKNRKFRFVVFGDFDLDGDGVATAAERDRLVSLINSWGGQVDNSISSQTDYLVMGEKPHSPAAVLSADAPATAPGTVTDERAKQQETYDGLVVEAKRLAIPVLNANRFLSMIGYYNTTVQRY